MVGGAVGVPRVREWGVRGWRDIVYFCGLGKGR
jgi:hypothetical protein